MRQSRARFVFAALALLAGLGRAAADEIKNPEAIFAGLDKITGRVVKFDVAIDETVQFGTLQITPRACYTKPQNEAPQTVSFMQVDELTAESKLKRIFSGWIFAASPGLNGIEHPVYDVWLIDCKGGTQTIPDVAEAPSNGESAAASEAPVPPAAAPAPPAPAGAAATSARPRPNHPATAPALGPPIEVGQAPNPLDAQPVAPPGPLAPDLTPPGRRRPSQSLYPPIEDDTAPPVPDPNQGLY
jgi:hypothetical protein